MSAPSDFLFRHHSLQPVTDPGKGRFVGKSGRREPMSDGEGEVKGESAGMHGEEIYDVILLFICGPSFCFSRSLARLSFHLMPSELSSTRPLNILVVEDDTVALGLLETFLTIHHHNVRRATGVEAAFAALAESPCEVLIADIGMPDGSGWYLLERAGPTLCPYAIAISGFGSPQDIADSAAAGFRHHLLKPFVPEDLIAALEEAAAILPPPVEKAG
ncbi:MAG: response regulator [Verrucomicrobiales bacterium]